MNQPLKYIPFETVVDTAFWHVLAKRKLEEYRLSVGPFPITAEYANTLAEGLNPRVTVDISSFPDSDIRKFGSLSCKLRGQMTVVNSLDEFKSVEKQRFIDSFGQTFISKALDNLNYLKDPECLLVFQLLAYCDLKKHKFYFWFCYPAVISSPQPVLVGARRLDEELSEKQLSQFLYSFESWRKDHRSAFFTVRAGVGVDAAVNVTCCSDFSPVDRDVYLAFCDPSTHEHFPGWPLRNMLFALAATAVTNVTSVRVICFRERYSNGRRYCGHSLVLDVELSPVRASSLTQFVGWEKLENKLKPRIVDLSASLDPVKLAESAVDLNLKLMKWRLMPDLKLDMLREVKCLLVGSGTLGCNVSRQLLAWGFRHITFVDNATVSMSNPVRQTLYTFNDAKDKLPKSQSAASALLSIFPGVSASGIQLDIPMPGHPVIFHLVDDYSIYPKTLDQETMTPGASADVQKTYLACCHLKKLICANDVVFLLTDTRESRWLPALLAHFYRKLVINVALGFDSYLVMRHGVRRTAFSDDDHSNTDKQAFPAVGVIPGFELGCYFCNDVVGPTNSTHYRAMDQQCTVTRPGVSMIASALAVELLVNLLHHPDKMLAPASVVCNSDSGFPFPSTTTDSVPHQIRGFLTQYSNIFPTTSAFKHCSTCSNSVLEAFARDGFAFLLHVFNDADYLEHVCGLTDLRSATENNNVIALSDNEQSDS